MISPQRKRAIGYQTAGSVSLPAPVGGLNDRDPLAAMPVTDAVILENWWPLPGKLEVRRGYTDWVTGFSNAVESLFEYSPPNGINRIFAASSGAIYDVTNPGVHGAPLVSGLTSNRWQDAQITTPGGNFLYLFNGVDKPLLYNGTTWASIDGGSSPIAITGVTTTLLVQGCVFKNRLFMVERDSMRVWYLPVNQVGGAATSLDLGAIFQRGGWVVGMFTWTIDAGNGADDHAAFISSNGEVAVYSGTDPSTAANWSLIGLFYLGKPVGRRCAIKYGGDLLVLCEPGVMPMSKALLTSSIDRRASISDKIQNSINEAIASYSANFGWELCLFPEQNALIVNIPAGMGANYQFAQNTFTGAWTKFTGWDAQTFKNTSQGLFYGTSTAVRRAWVGNIDGSSMIVGDALQSFQDFGASAQNKYFTMVRPYVQTNGNPSVLYSVNGDYLPSDPTGTLNFAPPGGMVWGSMVWGAMTWGGQFVQNSNWNTVGGIYRSAAIRLKAQSNSSIVEWASTSYVYQQGGLL
ncbi:hypothetical protein [Achromobacter ruhlandii]|uniref:Phage tail protein n=1 Tax=Achromobacter ruhlandii TaxID=72557 RepID=A0ABM8M1Y4_9BURK|nr:hypothetical protein [Achromobacter ruhlandii]AOU95867.1 uncharacterized protein AruCF_4976 [Achromobacter ruhlandii]MDC6090395.1 hypothetical protein [Achromobacter ruhlandii]WIW04131.1 hypothetical protein PPH40_005750 [Achromobacter ruhlandii]CAB3957290.1 hypothetical protein LMG7053_05244 [Achromobacter ruhlandii]